MVDAVAAGDKAPWQKYLADDVLYTDERGQRLDKTKFLAELQPLPKGYSGSIRVAKPESRILGPTAILTYDLDETETVYGQTITARYHATDTWMERKGVWQIVAGQVLRYYADPAATRIAPDRLREYIGTYELAPGVSMVVSQEGEHLYAKRGERPREELLPEAVDLFFRKGVEGRRLFRRDRNGKVDALIDRRNNQDLVWKAAR